MSDQQAAAVFQIQKLYIKNASFESPRSPQGFTLGVAPQMNLDLGVSTKVIEEGLYEVVVRATVNVQAQDQALFLVEVDQAGLFRIANFPQEQLGSLVGIHCPNMLYPYLREVVSDLVIKGGFPPLLLDPVDFESLYRQNLAQQQAQAQQATATAQ